MTHSKEASDHVDEELSGYIDGELTQQARQRVELHCSECDICQSELQSLKKLKGELSTIQLTGFGEDVWREKTLNMKTKTSLKLGWILFLSGCFLLLSFLLAVLFTNTDVPIFIKLASGLFYGGLGLLFISVLRQRLIERKTDKYKNVEI